MIRPEQGCPVRPFWNSSRIGLSLITAFAAVLVICLCWKTSLTRWDEKQPGAGDSSQLLTEERKVARLVRSPDALLQIRQELVQLDQEIDGAAREESINRLLTSVPDGDIESVLRAVSDLDGNLALDFQGTLVRRWADKDPASTAVWLRQVRGTAVESIATKELAWAWGDSDPSASLEWATQIPDESLRRTALTELGYEIARRDPKQSLRIATELIDGPAQEELLSHALRQWTILDDEAAFGWAVTDGSDYVNDRIISEVAVAMAEKTPEDALQLVLQDVSPGELQNRAAISVLQRWVQKEPAAAADWVAEFSADLLGKAAAWNLIDIWSEQNWEGPAQWLENLRNDPLRDTAISLLARKIGLIDTIAAKNWAEVIADASLRKETYEALAGAAHLVPQVQ